MFNNIGMAVTAKKILFFSVNFLKISHFAVLIDRYKSQVLSVHHIIFIAKCAHVSLRSVLFKDCDINLISRID